MFRFYHSLVPLMWKIICIFALYYLKWAGPYFLHTFLYYVVMMLWYVLTLFEKKHLSIQAWVRVMLVSVCKYHPLVLSLSLFLTCDISLGYMEKQRKEKNIYKKNKQKKNKTNAPVIWCLLWSLADVVTRLSAREDALHLALRVEGIFLLQNVSHTQREEKGRAMRAPLHFIRM